MKNLKVINITIKRLNDQFPWHAEITLDYESHGRTEKFGVHGHCPLNVIGRCGDSIERKLKQNESEVVA